MQKKDRSTSPGWRSSKMRGRRPPPPAGRVGGEGSPMASGIGLPSGVLATVGTASNEATMISSIRPGRGTNGSPSTATRAASCPGAGPSPRTVTVTTSSPSRHLPSAFAVTNLNSPSDAVNTSAGACTSTRVASTTVPGQGAPTGGNSHASGDRSCGALTGPPCTRPATVRIVVLRPRDVTPDQPRTPRQGSPCDRQVTGQHDRLLPTEQT